MNKSTRGGVRAGAGRKPRLRPESNKTVGAKVTQAEAEAFHKLGGGDWLRNEIRRQARLKP